MIKYYSIDEIETFNDGIILNFTDIYFNRAHVGTEFSKLPGIYIWFNDINTNKYIGSTECFHKRISSHARGLYNCSHPNYKLRNDFLTIGQTHFFCKFYPIFNKTRADLFDIEVILIKHFDSVNNGYNIVEDSRKRTFTNEQKQQIGKRMYKANLGKKKSKEHRLKCGISISKTNRGSGNPNATLSKEDVLYIRNNFVVGEVYKYCKKFNINKRILANLLHLRSYNYPEYIPENYIPPTQINITKKLSNNDVLYIRENYKKYTLLELSSMFDVKPYMISGIIHLKYYLDESTIPINYICPKMIKSGGKKVYEDDVLYMRNNYTKYTLKHLSNMYNLSQEYILDILQLYYYTDENLIPKNYIKPNREWIKQL